MKCLSNCANEIYQDFLKQVVRNRLVKVAITGAFCRAFHYSATKKVSKTEIVHSTQILQSAVKT